MYSLLHASKVLDSLQGHPNDSVRDDGALIQGVVAYLKAIVDQEGASEHDTDELPPSLSVERVYELIQLGCKKLAPSVTLRHERPLTMLSRHRMASQASTIATKRTATPTSSFGHS